MSSTDPKDPQVIRQNDEPEFIKHDDTPEVEGHVFRDPMDAQVRRRNDDEPHEGEGLRR